MVGGEHHDATRLRIVQSVGALALGAVSVAGFAPFHLHPLPILALAFLFLMWERARTARHAAWLGFVFGMGFFLTGTSWIYISLHTFGGMPAALTAIATFLFCVVISLYPALAGAVARALGSRLRRPSLQPSTAAALRLVLLMPASWTVGELLRGHLLTGFPWLALGYSQVPESPLAGYAAVIGSYGVSWVAATCAGALALLTIRLAERSAGLVWTNQIWQAYYKS